MFHALLLVVAAFFAGMMVFAGWEAWLAYRVYLENEDGQKAPGMAPPPWVTHAPPQVPLPSPVPSPVPVEPTPPASPAVPDRHVDEEVLAAIASADHYLGESELDDLFGPTTEG